MADEPTEAGSNSDPHPSGSPPAGEPMDLPKWNRARVKRKVKGAESDAFQDGARRAGRLARRRAPWVIGGIVLVAGAVGGTIYALHARTEARAEATRVLAEAAAYEARGQVGDPETLWGKDRPPPVPIAETPEELDRRVESALETLGREYAGSPADVDGHLVRGARALRAGDPQAAIRHFQAFLDTADRDHPLRFLALEGLGVAKEAAGDLEGALEAFDALAGAPGSFYRDQALAHKGRVLEALGRTEEAIEVYKTYATEYPFSETSLALEFVRERLAELAPDFVPPSANDEAGGEGAPSSSGGQAP